MVLESLSLHLFGESLCACIAFVFIQDTLITLSDHGVMMTKVVRFKKLPGSYGGEGVWPTVLKLKAGICLS